MAAVDDTALKAVQVKLVLLGEAAVGKSSLVLRFVQNDFNENTSPTIGAAFLTQKCRLENRVVKFEIWDTAGQERFHSLAPMYYRNAQAAVVVYDITKASSLEKAKSWVKELQRQASPNIVIALVGNKLDLVNVEDSAAPARTAAAAAEEEDTSDGEPESEGTEAEDSTDADADADGGAPAPKAKKAAGASASASESTSARQVYTAEAEAYAKESHLLFYEASAKTGQNVGELFTEIAKTIPLDTITPKPTAAGRRSGAAGAASGTNAAQGEGGVNLNDNQQAKKGGCC